MPRVAEVVLGVRGGGADLLQVPRRSDQPAVIAEVPFDLAADRGDGEGDEVLASIDVEALGGLHQAEAGHLPDVGEVAAACAVAEGQRFRHVEVVLDDGVAGSARGLGVGGARALEGRDGATLPGCFGGRPRRGAGGGCEGSRGGARSEGPRADDGQDGFGNDGHGAPVRRRATALFSAVVASTG
ncbi:hypothetical protein GCM10022256_34010 [Frondihabitans peucedani]|uniref:Uncharacterized protein n=1 Tax=Frondihabitans peucedani TaxID=598626 RepID=A0ABP8E6L6_9MICO